MESRSLLRSQHPGGDNGRGDEDEDDSDVDWQSDGLPEDEPDALDLYTPLKMDIDLPGEDRILTLRAVLVGIVLGTLVNASNMYLGLKTGFAFSASIFSAVFGYGILKLMSRSELPILGGWFGPQENCIIQAAATGAGGLVALFTAGIPAMYLLGVETGNPVDNVAKIITITLVCAFLGLFFATPLRSFFLVEVARELKLLFPSSVAVALTIKSMHAGATGSKEASNKLKALGISSISAFVQRVASYYAPGLLYDWHLFTWIHAASGYNAPWSLAIESWGWYIEWSPAFIGSGMMIGLNTALSLFGGSLMAWAVIGPTLVHSGECVGVAASDDPKWDGYYIYTSLKNLGHGTPSPRYWLLWPGVMITVCSSIAELIVQYRLIWTGIHSMAREIYRGIHGLRAKRTGPSAVSAEHAAALDNAQGEVEDEADEAVQDPARPHEQVGTWIWAPGLCVSVALALLTFHFQWGMGPGLTALACTLTFLLSAIVIQILGVTDQAPISAISKASQLAFGGVTRGMPILDAQRSNLVAGSVVCGGAEVAMDLVSDFRIGFLLGTPPIKQWIAQAVGTVAAAFLSPAMFLLFTTAYPCILSGDGDCPFGLPSVSAWAAVAQAVTDPSVSIPRSSVIFAISVSAVASAQVFARHFLLVGRYEWIRAYLPNWSAAGLAFLLPLPALTLASLFGAVIAWQWRKRDHASLEIYGYVIAAGLIAGEGFGGVVGAALELGGLSSNAFGTTIGCPASSC
ncbi:OPT superfamily oligopeptide transporter [Thozetella sp. PMI_491]|nr:OPT superfamily oligopeptide transporter [Thozetella sp. PMI_491]